MIVTVVVIVAVLCLLLLGLCFLNVRIRFRFLQENHDSDGWAEVSTLFGLVRLKKRLHGVKVHLTDDGPAVSATHSGGLPGQAGGQPSHEKTSFTAREVMHILEHWQNWLPLFTTTAAQVKDLMRKVHVDTLEMDVSVGTNDVVLTGLAYGGMWSVLSTGIGSLTYLMQFGQPPDIRVQANFQRPEFVMKTRCIANVRLGYAMLTAIRLLRVWRRRTTDGTPHPGTDENCNGKHPRDGGRQYDYRRSG